jgi:chromosome transmission fidelity protein 1
LTWLRNHKATEQEIALKEAGEAYKDEPSWVVEQLLSRKRGELLRQWEDREKRLASFRLKEKAQEERSRKRRRVEDTRATIETTIDEDAEWLLDTDDHDVRQEDALSGLSKESREILEKIGLGNRIKQADTDEEIIEEKIKVRVLILIQSILIVTEDDRSITRPEPIPSCHNLLQSYADLYFRPLYRLQLPKNLIFPRQSL